MSPTRGFVEICARHVPILFGKLDQIQGLHDSPGVSIHAGIDPKIFRDRSCFVKRGLVLKEEVAKLAAI